MTEAELAAVIRGIAPIVREQIATAVADARLALTLSYEQALGELRDRVLVGETKAATRVEPTPVDLAPVLERLAVIDAQLTRWPAHEQSLGDLRDQVIRAETKAVPSAPIDLTPVLERLAAIDARLDDVDKDAGRLEGYTANLQRDAAALSERVAVVETRAPVPGPAGQDGKDGLHGKDGADGLSFGDLSLLQEDDRTVVLRATRGDGVKELGRLTFPAEIYRGVYQDGKAYDRGDRVTWGGSEWHANETTTTKPGDGSKAWTLTVKRGRDGRDGVDAPGALPVVKVR